MTRQLQEKPETYVCIGRQGDFPARLGKTVFVGEEEIAVFHLTDGRLFALQNRSPHRKGGPLCEGMVSGDLLYDPLYDWKINLLDGKVQAPDTGQVKTYPVKIEGEHVWIGLN
ncbi:nitrite reductase small subunit NirD [Paenibacillus sp. UNC499MF]|uniref:nitrite reductase small subunit NirD n=1 Tax=Paenibacillus sp. UNC499MF TaxID=1502751 RepID=UPI00089FC06B|nr:nitrite reductase small subunit NirD [Paenibacillus sp. UNC499MF]SEF49511.1 nitrite reductase (NADH) small subunit [Paenibacillus sp. UNC499MF]